MEIEGAVAELEEWRRDELTVVGEDCQLGLQGKDGRDSLGRSEPSRGQELEAESNGRLGDRGRGRPAVAARRPRRGADDGNETEVRAGS